MKRCIWRSLAAGVLYLILQTSSSQAQIISGTEIPRFDFGAQFVGLPLEVPGTSDGIGVGVRAGYNFSHYVSLDGELDHFTFGTGPTQNSGTQLALVGVRAGVTMPEGGVYLKLRPGLVHFPRNGDFQSRGLTQLNHFALDAGFVLLRYFLNHTYLRLDLGDTVIPFGEGRIMNTSGQLVRVGTTNNAMISFGFGLHF
jgi:hypothetical protein